MDPPADDAGEVILYRTEDGRSEIQLRAAEGTVWLTQLELAELFATSKQNVSLRIKNVFDEGELSERAVVKESLTTAADGKRYRTKLFRDARTTFEAANPKLVKAREQLIAGLTPARELFEEPESDAEGDEEDLDMATELAPAPSAPTTAEEKGAQPVPQLIGRQKGTVGAQVVPQPREPTNGEPTNAPPSPERGCAQLSLEVPWGHNILLMRRVADLSARGWYLDGCSQEGLEKHLLAEYALRGASTSRLASPSTSSPERCPRTSSPRCHPSKPSRRSSPNPRPRSRKDHEHSGKRDADPQVQRRSETGPSPPEGCGGRGTLRAPSRLVVFMGHAR